MRLGRSLDNVLLAHASYDNERFRFTSLSLPINGCLGTCFLSMHSTRMFFSQISYLPRYTQPSKERAHSLFLRRRMFTLLVCLSFTNHGTVVVESYPTYSSRTEVSRQFGVFSALGRLSCVILQHLQGSSPNRQRA
jgi:hypothetical protein